MPFNSSMRPRSTARRANRRGLITLDQGWPPERPGPSSERSSSIAFPSDSPARISDLTEKHLSAFINVRGAECKSATVEKISNLVEKQPGHPPNRFRG